jgi:hypothetical protein
MLSDLNVRRFLRDGNQIGDLSSTLGISIYRHPSLPLVGLKYDQIESPKYHPIVRECRGIVLEDSTWRVVARPFDRFFNVGEDADAFHSFDWCDFDCTTKEDGSLIIVYHYGGEWHVNTSGSFGLGNAGWSGTSWRELFWRTAGFEPEILLPHYTYVFELCTPHNKVIRPYAQPATYLLGVIQAENGHELRPEIADAWAHVIGCPRPERHHFRSMAEITAFLEAKAEADKTFEGVVIRDRNDVRFKIKSRSYVELHRLHDNGNICNPKRLVPVVLRGERDEVVAYFPEIAETIDRVASEIEREWSELVKVWRAARTIDSQKDFALSIVKATPYSGLLFALRKRHGADQSVERLAELWRESSDIITKRLYA